MPRLRLVLAGTLALGLALTGCARLAQGSNVSPTPPSPSVDPDALLLRVQTGGGFVAPEFALGQMPEFSLMADGRVITLGPQIEIYPGPSLPSVQVRTLTARGIEAVMDAARKAGLDGPDRAYDTQPIADAPTTTFTFVEGGRRHVISAYALDTGGQPRPGGTSGEARARRALADLRSKLFDLEHWLPAGSVGAESRFAFDGLRVYVEPGATRDVGLQEPPLDWPLAVPLATFGSPVAGRQELRCGTVEGTDLAALRPLAGRSNQLSPWRSGGAEYTLVLRPLLPDESGC